MPQCLMIQGAIAADEKIIDTYVHGRVDQLQAAAALLQRAGLASPERHDHSWRCEPALDHNANLTEEVFDLAWILLGMSFTDFPIAQSISSFPMVDKK